MSLGNYGGNRVSPSQPGQRRLQLQPFRRLPIQQPSHRLDILSRTRPVRGHSTRAQQSLAPGRTTSEQASKQAKRRRRRLLENVTQSE